MCIVSLLAKKLIFSRYSIHSHYHLKTLHKVDKTPKSKVKNRRKNLISVYFLTSELGLSDVSSRVKVSFVWGFDLNLKFLSHLKKLSLTIFSLFRGNCIYLFVKCIHFMESAIESKSHSLSQKVQMTWWSCELIWNFSSINPSPHFILGMRGRGPFSSPLILPA